MFQVFHGDQDELKFMLALSMNDVAAIRGMLEDGRDPNASVLIGPPPLFLAGSDDMAATLLEFGAKPVSERVDVPVLHFWAFQGNGPAAAIPRIVKAGLDIDLKIKDVEFTALHLAAMRDRHEFAAALIDAGANPNLPNRDGDTPLDVCRCPKLCQELRAKGCRRKPLIRRLAKRVHNWF